GERDQPQAGPGQVGCGHRPPGLEAEARFPLPAHPDGRHSPAEAGSDDDHVVAVADPAVGRGGGHGQGTCARRLSRRAPVNASENRWPPCAYSGRRPIRCTAIVCASVNRSRPCAPCRRPSPEALRPPIGAPTLPQRAPYASFALPVRVRTGRGSGTPRRTSRVQIEAFRPYSVPLASPTASPSEETR